MIIVMMKIGLFFIIHNLKRASDYLNKAENRKGGAFFHFVVLW